MTSHILTIFGCFRRRPKPLTYGRPRNMPDQASRSTHDEVAEDFAHDIQEALARLCPDLSLAQGRLVAQVIRSHDARKPWRIGRHYGIHVYEGDRPVATFLNDRDAMRAVDAYNATLKRGV